MRSNLLIFAVAFILAFGAGYLLFHDGKKTIPNEQASNQVENSDEDGTSPNDAEVEAIPAGAEPLSTNSCISCHAVKDAGIAGGNTGPDLSDAYVNVKDKHGKELDDFLKEPTSAVMSGVIAENPLSDEDREQIVTFLKETSEK
ncbi:cytochrome C [Sporosarcina sp. PTS2304]|uniref:c-type cytochrome n=1 Tax=Sporosarcina sp. PTS2304 TaxID=2283194 RepID=UPI000E0D1986|nr:cytochrome c [Sporosarcina sp. PTS2304]AXH98284.1 cytochrome C [Sporosarcina sp. PTS2304]